ncbi:class I adenylate-forming enzyme family protein [Halococcus saccharolyticus]|uniref:AMP-dependent synthetase and ligase n=1 Tax=Halococcus saccharolyticus DSM 5350 TaxID=1227455 RepID=M0MHD1_9EURY|nr:class I adenylate-forming enzyme family protein [Halococcus saccharolyticus]EMA45111.1 AMP-dependent synthetase and ligase [Halococcus saccharolyticus DSM 5350]
MNFANYADAAARNAPEALAVGDRTRSLTFRELSERSDRVADALERRGVETDDRVAVDMPNGVAFVCAYLGTMKCGAVPVPVNTRFTDQQTRYVLSDSGAVGVVTADRRNADHGGEPTTHAYADLLDRGASEYDVTPRRSEEFAELLYTSGTTGAPKGVYHTHGNLDANANGFINYNEWSREDVALTVCPCFHVTGLNVTTTPFIALEAENHLLETWDIEAALTAIERHGVTYAFLIPTMVVELLDHEGLDEYDVSSLQALGVGGSPMPKERIDEVERVLGCTLLEGYGMTETTPLSAFNHPGPEGHKPGSVGRPATEAVALRIEDPRTGDAVERGARGELLWRGDTVTPRYNKRQITENNFVERDGERWLASGDIGWMDEDGFLFVVDRIEDMFTTGCGDVSPREIEEVIYEIDPVQKVAIIDTVDDVRGASVTTVIKRRSEGSVSAAEIKRACEAELESHEVPDRVEFVDEFPLTATGKIDRENLRDRFG